MVNINRHTGGGQRPSGLCSNDAVHAASIADIKTGKLSPSLLLKFHALHHSMKMAVHNVREVLPLSIFTTLTTLHFISCKARPCLYCVPLSCLEQIYIPSQLYKRPYQNPKASVVKRYVIILPLCKLSTLLYDSKLKGPHCGHKEAHCLVITSTLFLCAQYSISLLSSSSISRCLIVCNIPELSILLHHLTRNHSTNLLTTSNHLLTSIIPPPTVRVSFFQHVFVGYEAAPEGAIYVEITTLQHAFNQSYPHGVRRRIQHHSQWTHDYGSSDTIRQPKQ